MIDVLNILIGDTNLESKRRMICPTETTFLSDEFLEKNPSWLCLKVAYLNEEKLCVESKIVLSLLNAVITQKLIFFCFSRRTLEAIVKSDKNLLETYFSPSSYNNYLKKIYKSGIVRLASPQINKKKPGIYYISESSPLRKILGNDLDVQLEEALAFARPSWENIDDQKLIKQYKYCFSTGRYEPPKINSPNKESSGLIANLKFDQIIKEKINNETKIIQEIRFDKYDTEALFSDVKH